jgi:hypothetical protein
VTLSYRLTVEHVIPTVSVLNHKPTRIRGTFQLSHHFCGMRFVIQRCLRLVQPRSDWHRSFSISAYYSLKLLGLCSALLDVLMHGISEFQ